MTEQACRELFGVFAFVVILAGFVCAFLLGRFTK